LTRKKDKRPPEDWAVLAAAEARQAMDAAGEAIVANPARLGERGRAWLRWLSAEDRYFRAGEYPPELPRPAKWMSGEPLDLPAALYEPVVHPDPNKDQTPRAWALTEGGRAAWREANA